MRKCTFGAAVLLILFAVTAAAETAFVRDVEITLRTGPGTDHKIVTMLGSGQKLKILKTGKNWTQVRTSEGLQGYVLTRLLTSDEPLRPRFERLQRQYEKLMTHAAEPMRQIEALSQENETLKTALEQRESELTSLKTDFEQFKKDYEMVQRLKSDYQKSVKQLTTLKSELTECQQKLSRQDLNQNLTWFVIGASVLLVGFIIGFFSRRPRRRSSLL